MARAINRAISTPKVTAIVMIAWRALLSQRLTRLRGADCISGCVRARLDESRLSRTCAVPGLREDESMRVRDFSTENPPLHSGDELHCPHCRHWHPVAATHREGTE
jgi:hypothetical protein